MATIRMPSNGVDLLQFCSRHSEPHSQACFETYAHLVVAAAALGFRITGGSSSATCKSFLKHPGSIDMAIFRSQGLMPQMMSMGITCLEDPNSVTNEDVLARLIEDLAAEGLNEMNTILTKEGPAAFPWNFAEWIVSNLEQSGPTL